MGTTVDNTLNSALGLTVAGGTPVCGNKSTSDDSVNNSQQATAICCSSCSKLVTGKCLSIKCAVCNVSCHVTCLVNSYVTACGGDKLKNTLTWLTDFLVRNFHFVRSNCKSRSVRSQSYKVQSSSCRRAEVVQF